MSSDNSNLCLKKDGEGNECTRDKGHIGDCSYVTAKGEGSYTISRFQPGWVNQGDRPARRSLFLFIASAAAMFAIIGVMANLAQGLGMAWAGWALFILIAIVFAMGAPNVRRMIREYNAERKGQKVGRD